MGSKGTAGLYISLRYHLLNPNYLLGRLKELHSACVLSPSFCATLLAAPDTPCLPRRPGSACAWCCATWMWRTW